MAGKSSKRSSGPGLRWRRLALIVAAGVLAGATVPAQAERTVVRHQAFRATVPDGFSCRDQVVVRVRTDDPRNFRTDTRALQRLVGGLRATLGFECRQVKAIRLDGLVGGQLAWRGITAADNGWVLVETPVGRAEPEPAPEPSPQEPPPSTASAGGGSGSTDRNGRFAPSLEVFRESPSPVPAFP
jgi:hypothetical protein